MKKGNQDEVKDVVGKLNFTGQPFSPDSIFVNNMGENSGDEDESGEFENL